MSRRPLSLIGNAFFIFYCTAVGVYLILRPWTSGDSPPGLAASGFFRGFVSGLGLVHILAGVADLRALSRDLNARQTPPRSQ
jgi:predicted phage tail protein